MPGDVRRRWDRATACARSRRPSNKCNGLTYDADLNLIVCEHATSSLVRERPDGRREVLASHFEGHGAQQPERRLRPLRRLDLFHRSLVRPHAGLRRRAPAPARLPGRLPRRRPGGGEPQLLVDRYLFDQPNGLCFCPTEERLYVNDTAAGADPRLRRAPRRPLADPRGRVFASGIRSELEPGVPDGMKCDAARQRLGDGAGRRLGLRARRRASRQGARPRARRATCLGRAGLAHAVRLRDALGLRGADQGRPAPRALHAAARRRERGSATLRRLPRRRRQRRGPPQARRKDAARPARAAPSSSRTCRTTW